MSFFNDLKHWSRDLFEYPTYRPTDSSYDEYWHDRDMDGPLNSFQRIRAEFIASLVKNNDSVFDVGCGDGKVMAYVKSEAGNKGMNVRVAGMDTADTALAKARERGLKITEGSIGNTQELPDIERYDWVTLLEVIEHVPHSEALLAWALKHARKGIIFSVPNTGFIVYRLRLLFGRFPLQWRVNPSEHVRFWTLRDMRWWLNQLGYDYELQTYEGVPVLNRLWPSLFSAGIIVHIPVQRS